MLVGRNAPLAIQLKTRVTHSTHVWDFFKPNMDSEYPEVNGALSQTCYLRALDDCYSRFTKKQEALCGRSVGCETVDHLLFHSPYNKLVQKSFARMVYLDILAGKSSKASAEEFADWKEPELTYDDKALEGKLKGLRFLAYLYHPLHFSSSHLTAPYCSQVFPRPCTPRRFRRLVYYRSR